MIDLNLVTGYLFSSVVDLNLVTGYLFFGVVGLYIVTGCSIPKELF